MSEDPIVLREALDSTRRRYEVLKLQVRKLEELIAQLIKDNEILEARNKQLILQGKTKNKVIHQALEKANAQNNEYLEEINRLRKERDKLCLSQ